MNTALAMMLVSGVLTGGVYALVALGLVVIYKSSHVVNFSQGGLLMMGALIAWLLLTAGFPVWLTLLLTAIACVLVGYLVGNFVLRPLIAQPLLSSIMVTIALVWVFDAIGILSLGGEDRSFPTSFFQGFYKVGGLNISQVNLWGFIAAMVLFIIFVLFYRFTRVGLAMRGAAEDHEVIQSLGISVKRIINQSWMVSALTACIGGILLANAMALSPSLSEMGLKVLAVIILGGLESIPGCIVGGLLIGLLENAAVFYVDPLVGGGVREIVPYIVMMLILTVRPCGLFGLERVERI